MADISMSPHGSDVNAAAYAEKHRVNTQAFWSKVAIGGKDECWPWIGAQDGQGYGRFHVGKSRNSTMLAHRIAHGLMTSEEPEAVCHRCDNPVCCNPSHLFGGSRSDNNKDMADKGRSSQLRPSSQGERHHMAKLSSATITAIKAQYSNGGVTQYQLAKKYGVSQRTVAKAIHGLHVGFKDVEQTNA